MSNICFKVRLFPVFLMECKNFWVILLHEYRCSQCWRHEHSPDHRMFFAVFCSIHRRSFLSFPHLIIHLSKNDLDPKEKSNSVSSSPMMNCCALAPRWGQTTGFSVLSNILACALRGLTFVASLHRAFWCRRWQSWKNPCNQTHRWSWLCCDSFFIWFFLRSFWHHCRTICGTEMANVEQTQKMIPFVVWNFPCIMSASWFLVSMHLIWIFESNLIRSNHQFKATLWVVETCLIVDFFPL